MAQTISEFVARRRAEFAIERNALQSRIRVAVGVVEPFASQNLKSELETRDAIGSLSSAEYNVSTDDIF